jgi:hypothetical protein
VFQIFEFWPLDFPTWRFISKLYLVKPEAVLKAESQSIDVKIHWIYKSFKYMHFPLPVPFISNLHLNRFYRSLHLFVISPLSTRLHFCIHLANIQANWFVNKLMRQLLASNTASCKCKSLARCLFCASVAAAPRSVGSFDRLNAFYSREELNNK